MGIKKVWKVFKDSSMIDKDMQKAMRRACTPNACIEMLEENELLTKRIAELEEELSFLRKARVKLLKEIKKQKEQGE